MRPALSLRAQELALPRAEAMLLVDDSEAEIRELDVLLDQCVRPDDERAVTAGSRCAHAPSFRRWLAADEQLDRERGKALLEIFAELVQVLARKDLSRRHDHR